MPPTKDAANVKTRSRAVSSPVDKIEWAVAVLSSLLVLTLHAVFMNHAGALWRDEINSVNLAAMPSLSDALQRDSFPILWIGVLRGWLGAGLGNDAALRVLGFWIGAATVALLWFNARRMKISVPLVSIVLLGFSTTIIRWGDSIRPWGLGIVLNLLTFTLIWNVLESPTRRNIILATIAAVCGVNCIYYNAVLLLAICAGGAAVAASHRDWKKAGIVIGIGAIAAVSLLAYVSRIRASMEDYLIMQKGSYGFAKFLEKFSSALSLADDSGKWMVGVWILLALVAIVVALLGQLRPSTLKVSASQNDLLLYAFVTLIVGVIAYFGFLTRMKLATQAWYYAALMAMGAVAIEAMLSVFANNSTARLSRLVVVMLVGLAAFFPIKNSLQQRMTSVDLIAAKLQESAAKDDLILIDPWYAGITFDRYYKGSTPWMTVPPLSDHKLHRLDLIRGLMMQDQHEPMKPVLDKIAETLRGGHRLWLVGALNFPQDGQPPEILPPAPTSQWGWEDSAYYSQWSGIAGYLVITHAHKPEVVPIPLDNVLEFEQVPLIYTEGWRE